MQPLKDRLKTLAADVFNARSEVTKARAEVALDEALRKAYTEGQLLTTAENIDLVNTAHLIGLYAAKQTVEAELAERSKDMRQKKADFNRGARDALRAVRFSLDQQIDAKAALVGQQLATQSPAKGSAA